MAKKLTLINMRGRAGTSTLAAHLAWHYAAIGGWRKRVLALDIDPRAFLTQYLLGEDKVRGILKNDLPTLWTVFERLTQAPGVTHPLLLDPGKAIHPVEAFAGGGAVDLVASRMELAFALRNPVQKERALAKWLSKVEEDYDLILLDCPPTESPLTMASFLAGDSLLIPVKPGPLATLGVRALADSIELFYKHHPGHELAVAGVVFNAVGDDGAEQTESKREIQALTQKLAWSLFKNEVGFSRAYARELHDGKPIFRSSYPEWAQARRFEPFAIELAERIGLQPGG